MNEQVISLVPADPAPDNPWDRRLDWIKRAGGMLFREPNIDVNFDGHALKVIGAKAFKKATGLSPEIASDILRRDLPAQSYFNISKNHRAFNLLVGGENFHDSRPFSPDKKQVYSGYIKVGSQHRHAGLGRTIMRNEIEFFHAAGLKVFKIGAGFSGGYVWARFGFQPEKKLSVYFWDRLWERYNRLESFLSPDQREEANRLLMNLEDQDLWPLADTRMDVTGSLSQAFKAATQKKSEYSAYQRDDIVEWWFMFDDRIKTGAKVTLGQVLLAGLSWDGVLNLDDAKQMRRVERYVGGFKYVGFA